MPRPRTLDAGRVTDAQHQRYWDVGHLFPIAALVRGRALGGHFVTPKRPAAAFTPEAQAHFEEVRRVQVAVMMAGVKEDLVNEDTP